MNCPKCGGRLILRKGANGNFYGCSEFPECRYTESVPGKVISHGVIIETLPREPRCPRCQDKGYLPLIKNGKPIPNVRLYCDCHNDNPYPVIPLRPDDIDYPVSWDCYRTLCRDNGWRDPGPSYPPQPAIEPSPEPDWETNQWEQVTQLKAMVRHLGKKVLECQKVRPSKKRVYDEYNGLE